MDQHTTIELAPTVARGVLGIAKFIFAKEMASRMISAFAIAGLTFGLLELFMRPGLKFAYGRKHMNPRKSAQFKTSLLMIIFTLLPFIAAIAPLFARYHRANFMDTLYASGIAIAVALVVCFLFSLRLKSLMDNPPKRKLLLFDALSITGHTFIAHLADWISRLVMGLVNLVIKVIHRPFIIEYKVVAIVLNMIFSIIVLVIMGQSNEAGAANIMGSLIGGIMHAIMRHKKIAELREQYLNGTKEKDNELPTSA